MCLDGSAGQLLILIIKGCGGGGGGTNWRKIWVRLRRSKDCTNPKTWNIKKNDYKPALYWTAATHTQINPAGLCTKIKSNHKYINLHLPYEEDKTTKELSCLYIDSQPLNYVFFFFFSISEVFSPLTWYLWENMKLFSFNAALIYWQIDRCNFKDTKYLLKTKSLLYITQAFGQKTTTDHMHFRTDSAGRKHLKLNFMAVKALLS